MLDEPDVDRADLAEAIRRCWGRTVRTFTFLPIGLDARAFAYELVGEDGERLFLKLRQGPVPPIAVALPRYLSRIGLREVVAPLDTVDGRPPAPIAGHELLLYPFVEGGSRKDRGLSDQQWVAYGAFVGALHAVTLPPALAGMMRTEGFAPAAPAAVRGMSERIRAEATGDAMHKELAEFWAANVDEFVLLADRLDELARLAAARPVPTVVCHADIHLNNVLAEDNGPLHVVDWDAPILAPREQDLVFAISGGFGRHLTARRRSLFLRGYGRSTVDDHLLAYYIYERLVDDIQAFADGVLRPSASDGSRRRDLDYLRVQLTPHGPAAIARTLDARIRRA